MILSEAARLHAEGHHEESLAAIEALEHSPGKLSKKAFRKLRFLKADVFHDLERYREAIGCFDVILAEEVSDIAYANKALALWELREFRPALENYLKAIRLNPANAIAQCGAAEMHIKLDAPKSALPFLNKAVTLDTAYQDAYRCLGIAHFQLGSWAEAYRYLRKALELDPTDGLAKRGLVLIEKHFDEEEAR